MPQLIEKQCDVVMIESNNKAKKGDLFINGMFKLVEYTSESENKFYNVQQLYVLSDEEIKEGDMKYYSTNNATYIHNKDMVLTKEHFKVVAGIPELPSITYFDEAEKTLKERCGWVDIEKLADKLFESHSTNILSPQYILRDSFIRGFKTAQTINDKKFSSEEVEALMYWSANMAIGKSDSIKPYTEIVHELGQKIKTLSQPKAFDIEVEMEQYADYDFTGMPCVGFLRPKITNNSIKITKIL